MNDPREYIRVIPKETAAVWPFIKEKDIQNPGLLFDRFLMIEQKVIYPRTSRDNHEKSEDTAKKMNLEQICNSASNYDSTLLHARISRWKAAALAAQADTRRLQTQWRFVAGLGKQSLLEVGFTFDGYGFPVLPGSSVKGVARAFARLSIAEALDVNDLEELDDALNEPEEGEDFRKIFLRKYPESEQQYDLVEAFRTVFGTQQTAGRAIFLTAIPAKSPLLAIDIMTPHFPKYYGGTEPLPKDNEMPVPIYFLVVDEKTPFWFGVGWRGSLDENLRKMALDWLNSGLEFLGAGAKTGAGYGYFLPVDFNGDIPEPPQGSGTEKETDKPDLPVVKHRGVIVMVRPDKGFGVVRDIETEITFTFQSEVFGGNVPGKKTKVTFETQGETVVSLKQRYS